MKFFWFIIFLLIIPLEFLGQSYNYVQYTTRDGLAGNMVYDMCQDKDGFLWFGTENGLSRFDGKQFKNYTVKDGLPDNEVLGLYEDKTGRLWISTFSNEISYYWKGDFYNTKNDTNLRNFASVSRPTSFWESDAGVLWIMSSTNIYRWPKGERLAEYPLTPRLEDRIQSNTASIGPCWFGENPGICFNDSIFYLKLETGKLSFYKRTNSSSSIRILSNTRDRGDTGKIELDVDIIHQTWQSDFPLMIGTIDGAYEIDSVDWKIKERYLKGKGVANAMVDFEGIYWFATQGDGVFKLTSRSALTYKVGKEIDAANEIFSIGKRNDSIFTGHGGSQLIIWVNGQAHPYYFDQYLPEVENSIATNRLKVIMPLPDGDLLLGFDGFLVKWNKNVRKLLPISAIKTAELIDDQVLLVATGVNVVRVNLKNFNVIDTILNSRATSGVFFKNKYYLGTLAGLVIKNSDGVKQNFTEFHPSLKRRIVSLVKSKESIWIATSDSGIIEMTGNGKIGLTFSEKDGLSSNNCRSLFLHGDELWVGTNKGICKVNLRQPNSPIVKYTSYNLLPSDGISVLRKEGKEILVGSASGLTIFEEELINSLTFSKVFIDKIEVSGNVWKNQEKVTLPFRNYGLDIDFTGVSMKSAGDFIFYYRVEGLDAKWSTTDGNRISFASLPPGDYYFRIYAVNKFGVKSNITGFPILVETPFWRTIWFIVGVFASVVLLLFYIIRNRNKKIREKLEEKNQVEKQLASLEQKAIQAQMNPHFIFNSLNSIQQYILTNNVEDANRYLSIFAALIRETLENSSSGKISLNREIGYITKYLELERMRFGNTFDFIINANGLEMDAKIEFPVMLVQPYVENAVRHGMRYTTEGKGMIQIDFWRENNHIFCRIKDNGPGRAESFRIKSKQHIEYQSQGMNLTQRRVDILNTIFEEKILIEVKDIINEKGGVAGTEVQLTLTQITHETDD